MNTQDKTSLSLTQEVTGAVTTANALKMAIERLEGLSYIEHPSIDLLADEISITINACKEALEQPAQEPYAWATEWEDGEWSISHSPNMGKQSNPLYTHPHQDGTSPSEARDKEFVTLTDDEIKEFMGNCWESPYHLIKVIEQELKTKNGFSDIKDKNT
jgi:hypothetical protein